MKDSERFMRVTGTESGAFVNVEDPGQDFIEYWSPRYNEIQDIVSTELWIRSTTAVCSKLPASTDPALVYSALLLLEMMVGTKKFRDTEGTVLEDALTAGCYSLGMLRLYCESGERRRAAMAVAIACSYVIAKMNRHALDSVGFTLGTMADAYRVMDWVVDTFVPREYQDYMRTRCRKRLLLFTRAPALKRYQMH